jgi:hypothetical protein
MKKIFTLICALVGFAGAANAAGVDNLSELKHSYVLVCDELGARPGKGALFGADHFLDVTGGSTATNKGSVDLSVADGVLVTEEIAAKYGEEYPGAHLNFLRLKNDQDVIAMKVTAKSKIIIFYNNNGAERYPMFGTDSKPTSNPMANQGTISETVNKIARIEWTAEDDGVVYIGGKGGDQFLSYIIVEANEAPGTPTVKIGDQKFEGGLWFREVTCKANDAVEEGVDDSTPTVVTYTTDGTAPTAASPKYTEPIKCYNEGMTVKFQAFLDFEGNGIPADDNICEGADNEAYVSFSFDAPSIAADGATFTITSPYAEQNGENFYTLNGGDEVKGDGTTLTESATVSAFTKIANGSYGTFTSKSVTKDVYVLNPITEKKTIAVTAAEVVEDENSTDTPKPFIVKEGTGVISADKADFFVKNLEFGVVKDAAYQIEGQEAYIKMNNTNITFLVAAGDSVNVKVVCSKNSCKTLNADNDENVTTDRKCFVNVSGTTYGNEDVTAENGNVIEFGLAAVKSTTEKVKDDEGNETSVTTYSDEAKYFTFQKYSGTGNILISSIEITPAGKSLQTAISTVKAADAVVNAPAYNLAGQKVAAGFKGLVIKGGKKMIVK